MEFLAFAAPRPHLVRRMNKTVEIVEVGPRDGLQNEAAPVTCCNIRLSSPENGRSPNRWPNETTPSISPLLINGNNNAARISVSVCDSADCAKPSCLADESSTSSG